MARSNRRGSPPRRKSMTFLPQTSMNRTNEDTNTYVLYARQARYTQRSKSEGGEVCVKSKQSSSSSPDTAIIPGKQQAARVIQQAERRPTLSFRQWRRNLTGSTGKCSWRHGSASRFGWSWPHSFPATPSAFPRTAAFKTVHDVQCAPSHKKLAVGKVGLNQSDC